MPILGNDGTAILILSPHFDDAVLSLGGLLADRNGASKAVATFFGNAPDPDATTNWDRMSGFSSASQATAARKEENLQALAILGTESIELPYFDSQYGGRRPTQEELSRAIIGLLDRFPGKLEIYGPAIFADGVTHPDHKLLHEAFMGVAAHDADQRHRFFVYEDFPYVLKFRGNSAISLIDLFSRTLAGAPRQEKAPLTYRDTQLQAAALQKYASQIKAFSSFGEDLLSESRSYASSRCGRWTGACEVVYKIN
jgi:LmbE family N-acetylglucosaminyl deacetylase